MEYVYLIVFLCSIPFVWFILTNLNLEKAFQQGKVTIIRIAFIVGTIIISHLLASAVSTFVREFYSLFN